MARLKTLALSRLVVVAACLTVGSVRAEDCNTDDDGGFSVRPAALAFVIIAILVMMSGLFSGLTLGLLGLDKIGLQIVVGGDDAQAAEYAKKLIPVRENGNLLLCTLLLGNVAVNALLSIILADFAGGLAGFLSSTVIIVIFGEIIPQAACSRYALRVGAFSIPLVKVIIVLLYPLTKPLATVLDKVLGDELGTIFSQAELREMIHIHEAHGAVDKGQAMAIEGAIRFKDMEVHEVMTPVADAFMLGQDAKLSFQVMREIFQSGFSRVPVYGETRDDIIGMLFVKDLIFVDPEDETPIREFIRILNRQPIFVEDDDTLGFVLTVFKQGQGHMGIVRAVDASDDTKDPVRVVKGIITLEDIVEEILGEEIIDETDVYTDNEARLKVDRREFDMTRLNLIDTKVNEEKLSPDEVNAITSHLCNNNPRFETAVKDGMITPEIIKALIATKNVVTKERIGDGVGQHDPQNRMYTRLEPSSTLTVMLSGKLTVFAGRDGFTSELGPWSVLGADALWDEEFAPDFTAAVSTDKVRCIQITRSEFIWHVKRLKTKRNRRQRQTTLQQRGRDASFANGFPEGTRPASGSESDILLADGRERSATFPPRAAGEAEAEEGGSTEHKQGELVPPQPPLGDGKAGARPPHAVVEMTEVAQFSSSSSHLLTQEKAPAVV